MNTEQARINMINQQCRAWGVLNQPILDLLSVVPREHFVPHTYQSLAFADTPIPLSHGQFMLVPKEEARIIDVLSLQSNERILEIGTGSGYFTALLAHCGKHVESVDIFEDFIEEASQKLAALNIHNVMLNTADAAAGYKKNVQYDVIVITGSLPYLPKSFIHQVSVGGRLFAFIGKAPLMQAVLMTHVAHEEWRTEVLFESYVTPLINALQPSAFVF